MSRNNYAALESGWIPGHLDAFTHVGDRKIRLYDSGGPAPSNQTVVQTNLPEYAKPFYTNLMERAQAESYRPYTPYEGDRLAGFSPAQLDVQREVMGMETPGEFNIGSGIIGAGGIGSLGAGSQYFSAAQDPNMIGGLMSPFMQNVVDIQKQGALRDARMSQLGANLASGRLPGSLGSSGALLAQTERERALGGRLNEIQATGLQKAYEDAQKSLQFGADLGLRGYGQAITGGQALGQMGTARQEADLRRLTAQEAVGSQQREMEQKKLDQEYADFLRQRDYPMEQLGYFSNLLRGLPVGLNTTQTTYNQSPSAASQVAGLGLTGLGLYNMTKG